MWSYERVKNVELKTNSPEVIQNILRRRNRLFASPHATPDDGRRIGLVVQGGNMRGLVSGGALVGLEALGLSAAFDVVYGSSAGAINSAYFLAGQAAFGATIYYEDLIGTKFIDFRRFPRIVNLDYLSYDVMVYRKPLRIGVLRKISTPLVIFATDIETGNSERFSTHAAKSDTDVLLYLHASAAVPAYYNKPIEIDGRWYLDSNASNPIPISSAIADGCTDILVCLTRPVEVRARPNPILGRIESYLLRKLPKAYREAYNNRHQVYNLALDTLLSRKDVPTHVNIYTLSPRLTDFAPSRITTRQSKLKRAAAEGIVRAFDSFNAPLTGITELLTVVESALEM